MKHQREHWASKLGFVMAALGSAIGLGTLWKFPYVTGANGGGIFVLLFFAFTVIIGIPVFIGELMLGRRAQRGVVGIFTSLAQDRPAWKAVGWLSVLSPLLILSFYDVVAGWGLNYVFLSLTQFWQGLDAPQIEGVFDTMVTSGSISLLFHFLFTLITMSILFQGVRAGIEYWSRIMTFSLLVLLVGLLCYAFTLDGFGQAFHFVLSFDSSQLKPSGVLEALGLAFFTLSLGQGVMLTYGSYMTGDEDLPKTAGIVAISNVFVSLLAALVIFPIIFSFGFTADKGEGLIFQTLPVVFAQLPGALILSTLFFLLFTFTALTSAIALMEVIVANLTDLYSWSRRKAACISGLAVFIVGIPCALSRTPYLFNKWDAMYNMSYLATIDSLVNVWILPFSGLFTSIFVGWILTKKVVQDEFVRGTKWGRIFPVWRFTMRWIVPTAIIIVLLQVSGLIDFDRFV